LRGVLDVTVRDGPTGRVLQRARVVARSERMRFERLRARVMARLRARLLARFDVRRERVAVDLLEVESVPEVDRAVAAAAAGDWARARNSLERLARNARGLEPEQRARLLYNLGQARRFDPSPGPQRLPLAARALREAARLDPDS